MRKVTTINLNNNAYQIDEDGYGALRTYLDNASRALDDNPDREEILADIEQAIADKCAITLGPHKTVVSLAEIEAILKEMGPVAGSAEPTSAEAGSSEQTSGASAHSAFAPGHQRHRLYRIREGQKWAGICQGLSAYTGIDVTLIRVALVLLTIFAAIFNGIGVVVIVAYIVMAFIIPVAESPEEVAAAHGQPFRAQEFVDRLRSRHEDRADRRARRREKRRMHNAAWWSRYQPPSPAPGVAARVTGGMFLPLLTVLSAAWFSAMATIAYLAWHGWYLAGLAQWPPGVERGFQDIPRWVAMAAIVAIYALLALPIGAARRASLYYANGGRMHGWADAWSGILWLALVAVLLLSAWYALPQLQDLLQQELNLRGVISV